MTGQQCTYEEMKAEECWEEEEWKMEDRKEALVQIKKEQDLQEQDLQEVDPLQENTQVLEARSTMLCIKCHQGQSLFLKLLETFYFLCAVSVPVPDPYSIRSDPDLPFFKQFGSGSRF
jgi:hypothetical protein